MNDFIFLCIYILYVQTSIGQAETYIKRPINLRFGAVGSLFALLALIFSRSGDMKLKTEQMKSFQFVKL